MQQTIETDAKTTSKSTEKLEFTVEGMTCASCAVNLENFLKKQKNIETASVSFPDHSARITLKSEKISVKKLQKAVKKTGFQIIEKNRSKRFENEKIRLKDLKNRLIISSIFTFPIFIFSMFWEIPFSEYILFALSLPVLVYGGKEFFVNAFKQARQGMSNMDTLVALSTGTAFLFSVLTTFLPEFFEENGLSAHVYYESAAVIITLILVGKYAEESAKSRTSFAVKKLMQLQPDTVTILENGKPIEKSTSEIQAGDCILVRAGERVSADGQVIVGQSFVDESMLSGEPLPVAKKAGDLVKAGTINQNGALEIRAKKVGNETLLARIIQRVEEAQAGKPPIQKMVDKIAGVFVPTVLGIAILTFVIWLVFGEFAYAFSNFIAVLIIACPCALGLATPTALTVGIGRGASLGILIKDAEQLQKIAEIDTIVLDKTGTITEGNPKVTNCIFSRKSKEDEKVNFYQKIIYLAESKSDHPLAKAVLQYFENQFSKTDSNDFKNLQVTNFKNISGKGIQFKASEKQFFIGNKAFIFENKISIPTDLDSFIKKFESEGKTLILTADKEEVFGVLAIADTIKESTFSFIKKLYKNKIEVFMLTGDHEKSAQQVAQETGIKNYKAGVLPDEKGKFIQDLQNQGKIVAMTGDGINDSEALARADVGISLAGGSDIALESAGMTLLNSDLNGILTAKKLSEAVLKTIRQNLFWAFIYNVLAIPLAMGVLYPLTGFLLNPMVGGLAMAMSSVSVVSNSLRLKYKNIN